MTTDADQWTRVAEAVRAKRTDLGLNQAELALRSGVSEPTIRVIETARRSNYQATTLRSVSVALWGNPEAISEIRSGAAPSETAPSETQTLAEKLDAIQAQLDHVEHMLEIRRPNQRTRDTLEQVVQMLAPEEQPRARALVEQVIEDAGC